MTSLNINVLIGEYFHKAPDLISIDTEGLDLDILKSLDFNRFRPPIVSRRRRPSSARGPRRESLI